MNQHIPENAQVQVADLLRELSVVDPDDDTMPVFLGLHDKHRETLGSIGHWTHVDGIAARIVDLLRSWSPSPQSSVRVFVGAHSLKTWCSHCDNSSTVSSDTATDRYHFADIGEKS